MDNRAEVREFLTTRRAKITPGQAGLPQAGQRRVLGLRRGEVAGLAGVSIEYYSKLERGNLAGVSASVIEAISRALQLDPAEREHLFDLAQDAASNGLLAPRRRSVDNTWRSRQSLQWTLDAFRDTAAAVGNGRGDLLAAEPGVAMTVYTAEPGSPTAQALQLLASWAATQPADRPGTDPAGPGAPANPSPRDTTTKGH